MMYSIPIKPAKTEIVIKKSRFIACADQIVSREAAMEWLGALKKEHPDARHHCWAYLIGHPNCASNVGMGDDGEPSGTAGKPILNVLNHRGVGDVMVVVVRYFGGIKLGTGGLTRAYSQATTAVMDVLLTEQQVEKVCIQVTCLFALESFVRHWVEKLGGQVLERIYGAGVEMKLSIPVTERPALTEKLGSRGSLIKSL